MLLSSIFLHVRVSVTLQRCSYKNAVAYVSALEHPSQSAFSSVPYPSVISVPRFSDHLRALNVVADAVALMILCLTCAFCHEIKGNFRVFCPRVRLLHLSLRHPS